jgi:hypothetical protein
MNQRQLASVLFAVLGAFIAISWLPQIVVATGLWAQPIDTSNSAGDQAASVSYAISLLIGTLIAVLLGILLILGRDRLAERLFPANTGPLAVRETQAVALSVLGCYFVIGAISRLVGLWLHRIDWSAVAQLVLGVGLFLGARGVARFWAAVRSGGSSTSNDRAA